MTKKEMQEIAAIVAATLASAGDTDTPAKKDTRKKDAMPGFLSCWKSSKVTVKKDGTFAHNGKTYRVLNADAVADHVAASIAAGNVYAVAVKK